MEEKIKDFDIDKLAYTSALDSDPKLAKEAQDMIRAIGKKLNVYSASINDVYMNAGKTGHPGFTVPAMNVRMLTYDFCRRAFRIAVEHNISNMIFEIAASEQKYTGQPPSEYSASVIAAAIKEGYKGPVYIQGDHYQFKADMFQESPDKEVERLKHIIQESIDGGFYNIDIDGSTLVELDKPTVDEQQKNNYEMTALLTEYIRSIQPSGVTISIGGEIGHIGGVNSTVDDFKAFMDGYLGIVGPKNLTTISKVSVQTGSSHGGVPLPDGTIEKANIDFNVLKDIGNAARQEYHIGGPVQHGASTLPEELFDKFPEAGTLEIHLATGLQNIVYDNMDGQLKEKIYAWLRENAREEFKEGMTDEQFMYKARKKAWGAFKKEMWLMNESDKNRILDALESRLRFLFEKLHVI